MSATQGALSNYKNPPVSAVQQANQHATDVFGRLYEEPIDHAVGSTAGKVKIKVGNKVVATKTVRAGGQQRFVVKVSASKLKVGINKLQAQFSGNASTKGSKSTKITVQVMRS